MASGFITFKDGRYFAGRWTGFDEIILIAIKELQELEGGLPLADWLKTRIPTAEDNEEDDAGWGFHRSLTDDWINRDLDLRSLTPHNQQLLWKAFQNGNVNFKANGKEYSCLLASYFDDFYKMFEQSETGEPLEITDRSKLADPCTEKYGPGWE